MEVYKSPKTNKITYYLQTGTTGTGTPIFTTRTFSNINPTAFEDNESLWTFADKLGGLFAQYVSGSTDVKLTEEFDITCVLE